MVEGKTYYVKALSANGYPAYNRDKTADVEFITSQAAPRSLTAVASSQNEISISVMSDDPVIVAMSTEAMPGYQKGYAGVFGTPSSDAKTGDDLAGGGKVVYAGDPADFDVTTAPNELTYFRAWTVRNGHLSSTSTDAIGIAMPSYPYAPAIENYPFGEQLRIWEATENQFIPWLRSYAEDRVLYAVTLDNQEVVLQTPELPLDCPVKVSFEFALETQRAAASGDGTGGVELPQGNEPGLFGDTGYLKILAGSEVWRIVNSYAGTMVSNGDGGYISGSSTFEAVSVDIPAIDDCERITFSFSVPTASMLYLRNIIIETTGESPTAPATIPSALWADENRDGIVTFGCTRAEDAAATLVLYSNQPLTDAELPEDGRIYTIGSKIGSATVLYYGPEEEITCATPISLVPDFDADCYFRAVSASSDPCYNLTSTANLTYHTLPDMGYPENLSAILTEDGETIEVKADKAPGAEGTLLLVSASKFEGVLEDGMAYAEGDAVGNATVLYRGTDSAISVNVAPMEYGNQTIITGYSYNPCLWYSSICSSATVTTTSIEEVVSVATDLSTVEVYNIFGQRLSAKSLSQLPAGVYIINGSKMVLR